VTQSQSNALKLAKLQSVAIADALAAELARCKHPNRQVHPRWLDRMVKLEARLETQRAFIASLDRELAGTEARPRIGAPRLIYPQRAQHLSGLPIGSHRNLGQGGSVRFGYQRRPMRDGLWVVPLPAEQGAIERMIEMKRKGATLLAIQTAMAAEGFELSRAGIAKILRRET
jgi:hypothetical protein